VIAVEAGGGCVGEVPLVGVDDVELKPSPQGELHQVGQFESAHPSGFQNRGQCRKTRENEADESLQAEFAGCSTGQFAMR